LDLIRGWIIYSDGLEKIADYLVVGQLAPVGARRSPARDGVVFRLNHNFALSGAKLSPVQQGVRP
jgi:hypothetical protein